MSDNKNTATALDDERRVKVLSPGQLVAKRFFRNRLAMVGLIILVTMFVFSFIGGMVSPIYYDKTYHAVPENGGDLEGLCRCGLQQQLHFQVCRRTGAPGCGAAEIYPGSQ